MCSCNITKICATFQIRQFELLMQSRRIGSMRLQNMTEKAINQSLQSCSGRSCEAQYSTSPMRNLTLTQTHTTSDVIPAMLNVVPHVET